MVRPVLRSLLALALFASGSAHADAPAGLPISADGQAPAYGVVATAPTADGVVFARQVLPPDAGATTAFAQSRILYLNRKGVTLRPGANDSRVQHSTLVASPTTIAPWKVSDAQWATTLSCFRQIWAPFQVTVVETDPGNVPHIEAVFGGSPQQLGLPGNVGGVSPFTSNCGIIENSVVFAFTENLPPTGRTACEVMAQEVAHSFGLDHELLAADPMTYLSYTGNRAFQDKTASCGESKARPCGINGSVCRANQNSVALLTAALGKADPTAPVLAITAPADGATVDAGFTVSADATDNVAVTSVELTIDGTTVATLTAPPYTFTAPSELPDGTHTVEVQATDGSHVVTQTLTVTQAASGTPPSGGGNPATVPDSVSGGCAAGGDEPRGILFALALGLGLALRRPR
jgi:hypothetical protein